MPRLILPGGSAGQPSNARASDTALASDCQSLLLPTSSGWSDALGMLSPTGKTGTPTTVANASGVARSYASSADFFLDSGLLDPTAGYAWLIHGTLVSSGGNWGGLIARTSDNTTTAGWSWQKDGSGNFVVYHGSSTNYSFGSMAGLVDGLPHTLIGLWRPSGNAVELWRDGLLVGSGTLTAPPVWSAGAGQIKLFSSRDTAAFTGTASLLALFTDGIESGTAERLSANPWQLFGGRRVLYFDTVGGGSGVTIDAAIGDTEAYGVRAGISAATTIAATLGVAEAAGLPADISQGVVIVAGVGGASAAGRQSNIASAVTITTTAGNAAAAGITAAIEAAGGEIACLIGDAEVRGLVAGIAAGVTVHASVGAALAVGLPSVMSTGDGAQTVLSAPRAVYSNIQTAARSNIQTARRPRA